MSRLASAEKMQFYPTSKPDTHYICQRLVATGDVRLLDPCAGEGQALAELQAHLKTTAKSVTSYAVELDVTRYERCLLHFPDTTLNSDWFQVVNSNDAVSLLFANPPYDYEVVSSNDDSHKKMRLEWNFLRNAEDKLQPGGVLIFIVPQLVLANTRCARHLATWYDNINIYSVVDGEFEKFKQVILFGVKRTKRQDPPPPIIAKILTAGKKRPKPIDAAPIVTYTVPSMRIPANKYTFRKMIISRAETLALIANHGAQTTAEYKKLDHPDTSVEFVPVMPLNTGHVAALASSGTTPVINLGSLIIRGSSSKAEIVKDANGKILDGGRNDPNSKKATQTFISDLYVMNADGEYELIRNDPERFQALMEEHGAVMHRTITQRYKPLYEGPTDAEWAATARYMHGKKLPGKKSTGLLPMQRHIVIAGTRTLRAYHHANYVCDMGTGKTAMSLATVDMLNAWPAIVYGPGHMVEKWAAEIPKVVPDAKGFIAYKLADVSKFIRTWKPGDKWVLIMGYEVAKLGAGPVAIDNRPGCRRVQKVYEWDEHGNVVKTHKRMRPMCPKCGAFVELRGNDQAVKCKAVKRKIVKPDGTTVELLCNEPLYQKSRYRRWQLADYIHKQAPGFFKTLICDEAHKTKGKGTDIARAFHQLTMATKYTINLTGTLFGGKSTDLFFMLYRLMREVRANFGVADETKWSEVYGRLERKLVHTDKDEDTRTRHTSGSKVKAVDATEKPGISPRIYQLLLKTTLMLRIQDLGYKLPPYQETVVTLDMTAKQKEQYQWLDGELYTEIMDGLKSFDSDLIKRAQQLLSVWLTETRLRPNEGYRSRPILWTPPHDKDDKGEHEPWLIKTGKSAEYGYTADDDAEAIANGAIAIALPPGDQRGRIIVDADLEGDRKEAMHLYPVAKVDELLPKEQWLLQFCLEEQRQGRKTIIGIEQTGRRDIQPRIATILDKHGIKTAVLPDELKNSKREAWIAAHTPFIDVLITNPRKVETGLDLIQFANLVVYELTTSLFVLAQFVKRVWRLGQTQPVKTYYLVYRDTTEHRMLGLMAQKVMAAALLYGDNASSAMSAETDEEDLMAALAKAALNKLPIPSGIDAILAPEMRQDESIEMVDDVDAAELAAMFDAEEREDAQAAFDDLDNTPTLEQTEEAEGDGDDGRNAPWWLLWQDLAKNEKPAKKKKKPATPSLDGEQQLDFFTMAALAATSTDTPKPKPQPSVMVAASAHSTIAVAQQAMLF